MIKNFDKSESYNQVQDIRRKKESTEIKDTISSKKYFSIIKIKAICFYFFKDFPDNILKTTDIIFKLELEEDKKLSKSSTSDIFIQNKQDDKKDDAYKLFLMISSLHIR